VRNFTLPAGSGFGPPAPALIGREGPDLTNAVLRAHSWWMGELRPCARQAWLFGSVARGTGTLVSDVDVLVRSPNSDSDLGRLEARLTALVGRTVHLVRSSTLLVDPDPLFALKLHRLGPRLPPEVTRWAAPAHASDGANP
jgi:predicted nucleotidyltransferase